MHPEFHATGWGEPEAPPHKRPRLATQSCVETVKVAGRTQAEGTLAEAHIPCISRPLSVSAAPTNQLAGSGLRPALCQQGGHQRPLQLSQPASQPVPPRQPLPLPLSQPAHHMQHQPAHRMQPQPVQGPADGQSKQAPGPQALDLHLSSEEQDWPAGTQQDLQHSHPHAAEDAGQPCLTQQPGTAPRCFLAASSSDSTPALQMLLQRLRGLLPTAGTCIAAAVSRSTAQAQLSGICFCRLMSAPS